VVAVFGAHALLERGREHKKRNITAALPERRRGACCAGLLRGTAAGGLAAARGFRELVGYRARPILVAARRAHDAQCNRTARRLDGTEKAA
jgi:hypothetical protein